MKKLFLSAFVILTFIIYSLSNKSGNTVGNTSVGSSLTAPQPNSPSSETSQTTASYRDGTYTGDVTDAFYGNIQVQAKIQGGKITDIQFLNYPHDRQTSLYINSQAMPLLKNEAIQAQSARVDAVSGASATSQAFIQSLRSALSKAQG